MVFVVFINTIDGFTPIWPC